ncbi:MAG: TonB-dependent receptor [Muribaculaceae bacterium]|nr:TonB-dependent receptor [Muribaculaceae bacterium]
MKRLVIAISLLAALSAKADVTGRVTDASGEPVADALVSWTGSNVATTTDENGEFSIRRIPSTRRLIVSYFGFVPDTLTAADDRLDVVLRQLKTLEEVEVTGRRLYGKLRGGITNTEMISGAELARAACCNLGESFTTNPSVDVGYSDAATGAKQIKLLGLAGTYVQLLTENVPNYRGPATPFSLGYIPGPWMQSIQVSKGASSVKNGYESITGQINIEFKKPQTDDEVNVNLYGNTQYKAEANFDANAHLSKRLSTSLLGHYENYLKTPHDGNGDGFADMPRVEQYNLRNRWAWMGDHYVFQASVNALKENRDGGQTAHGVHSGDGLDVQELYRIRVRTDRYEAFTKNAYIFDKEKSTNLALILSGSLHNEDAGYGHKLYDVKNRNAYASLMFETNFDSHNSLSTGLSFNYDYYRERFRLTNDTEAGTDHDFTRESVYGAYAQYTYNLNDRLIMMAGLRADNSNIYNTFITPRAHLKFIPNDHLQLRASAGKGYRTPHVLAENNYLLASGRRIVIEQRLEQEEAWNYGFSATLDLRLFNRDLSLSGEYYYTDFRHQTVTDLDTAPHAVLFYNLDGKSFSHTWQLEATYEFFRGLTATGAYRRSIAKSTYGGKLMKRPLASDYKGLLTASYQTPLGLWQFDVTLQFNGGGRMPTPYTLADGNLSWNRNFKSHRLLSAQITRRFRHWSVYIGGENLTNFKQKNPIAGANDPWGDNFDSTMIWGPIEGAMGYIGVRYNWHK